MVDPLFIGDTATVRRLARSVVTDDFSDPQIIEEQKAAYSKIIIATQKSDWTIGVDNRFYAIRKAEEQLAAAFILEYYGDGSAENVTLYTALRDAAQLTLTDYETTVTGAEADAEILITSSENVSYPASLEDNPNATPYRSTGVSV